MTRPATVDSLDSPAHRSGWRVWTTALITVAAVIHGVRIAQAPPLQSANDRSRWCTVWSLLERGTYQIDEIRQQPGWDTIDLVRVDGHFYSSKPPLMSTWVAAVTWSVCRITGWDLLTHPQAVMSTTLLLVNGLPFVLMLIALARVLKHSPLSDAAACLVLSFAAFGTLWSPFLSSLNNHTVAATGAFFAGVCWIAAADSLPGARRTGLFFVWGLSAGIMAAHDLPAALLIVLFGWHALRIDVPRTLGPFAIGVALPVVAFIATNVLATGTWRPAYAGYGGETYVFIHEGIPSYWANPQGVDRNLDSPLVYAFHSILGHHGLLSLTPVWCLVLVGAVRSSPRVLTVWRQLNRGTLLVTALLLGFYLSRTENYNYGGVSCGLRWALLMVPLATLSLIPALVDWQPRWPTLAVVTLLLGVSVYSAWEPGLKPWQQPWLFRAMEHAGWIGYRDTPPPWEKPLYTWFPRIPEPNAQEPQPWVQFERDGVPNESLRLQLLREEQQDGRTVAVLKVTATSPQAMPITRTLHIDRQKFAEGRPTAEFVLRPRPDTTDAELQSAYAWVRSLPLLKAYQPGHVRYLKTRLRTDALECQRTASQVEMQVEGVTRRHRTDVWLSAELPFGVARRDVSVSDPATGAILQQESWIVTASSPPIAKESPLTIETLRERQAHPDQPLPGVR
ncbi:MAG TPA: hypothetical protein VFG20_05120 [Planctomycetaceae bacterium]|nr:hypothetical protein [Planctomycetaceae bacterium]